ncbi:MAG: hypothetical protein WBH56_18265 [Bacteroidota bacterium]
MTTQVFSRSLLTIRRATLPVAFCLLLLSLFSCEMTYAEEPQAREIAENVFVVSDPEVEEQLVLQSAK